MKKIILIILAVLLIISGIMFFTKNGTDLGDLSTPNSIASKITNIKPKEELVLEVPKISSKTDYNENGIPDSEDILAGARMDADNKPTYIDEYYEGGYPPDNKGVCTDVIWRALKVAGYNLKDLVDEDIANNISKYPRVEGKPDKNIDFRRVTNLIVFFDRYAKQLTLDIIPNDIENLKEWQAGDIVVFDRPTQHMGIVSDKRTKDGVPYMIHNSSPYTVEANHILYWNENVSPMIRHYRISE